jgi:tetratricopeptide (TPR) repeat protein
MKLPEGWGVELPEAVHAKSAYATLDETFRFDKGTIYAERRVEVLKEQVPVADWKSYKKWSDDADLAHEQWIQLVTNEQKAEIEKKLLPNKATKAAPWESYTAANTQAAKLVSSAHDAIERKEFASAKSMLDQAKDLNSSQASLWAVYGYYEFQRGEISAAIPDFQKELSIHPERPAIYSAVVQAQLALGQRKEAMETLKKWAAADSNDASPIFGLVSMLLEDGNATEAVAAAEAGLARLSDDKKKDERLQLILGRAQIKAGMKEKGRDTLLAMMKSTQNPMMLNDSAYELAEAGEELPADETAARKAMEKLTEESKTWTLDENPQTLTAKSRQLIATWDTLGWILFREGKLDEADNYLKAAWRNVQSDVMAEHVGAVAEARGRKDEALSAYVLGIAASRPGDEQKKLQERADALRKAGAKSAVSDARTKLQDDRKISIGPAKGMNGVTEYRLLLSDGQVVRAEKNNQDDKKEIPEGEEKVKETKLVGLWPAGSQASLVRYGMLNCHSAVCELMLEQQQ